MVKNICIVGYGFVGQAVHASLNPHIINTFDFTIVDPKKTNNILSTDTIRKSDFIFICVPTPANDFSIFEKVIQTLNDANCQAVVVIKSTITNEIFNKISKKSKLKFVFNPEFLDQNTYIEDSQSQNFVVLGGDYINTRAVQDLYSASKLQFKNVSFKHCTVKDAINFKYTRNLYGAYKVLFWEFIQDRTGNARLMYDMYKNLPQGDMAQVGMDGFRGYGGACFPKDVENFHNEESHQLTEFLMSYNNFLQDKEKENKL